MPYVCLGEEVLDDLGDALAVQTEVLHQHVAGGGGAEGAHTHETHGRGLFFGQKLGHGRTHAARNAMLFAGHDMAGLGGAGQNDVLCQRLNAEDVDDHTGNVSDPRAGG